MITNILVILSLYSHYLITMITINREFDTSNKLAKRIYLICDENLTLTFKTLSHKKNAVY